jgi:predicted DNA-binding transcriptional regulator YafY
MSCINATIKNMRASRLLSIQMLLQTRGRMSATQLAAELEVSPRTVLRDIDQLSAAGVPVWADRGRDGGFQLREGWRTQLTGLTDKEAQALFLAGLPSAATALGLGHASASAQLKMLASLPPALQADAQQVSARLHVDTLDWFRNASAPEHLQSVADAVWHQRAITMRYDSWTGERERSVKPLGLVLKAGVWYMVALPIAAAAEKPSEPRTYRLSNILSLTVQEKVFKRPKRFDLPKFWQAATKRFETDIYTATATVRLTARGIKLLKQVSPAIHQAITQTAVVDPLNDGWSLAEIPIESVGHATNQLLALGLEVEVLAPAGLRESVAGVVRELGAMYRQRIAD